MTDHSASRRFPRDPAEIARARQMVRANLEAWGFQRDLAPMELAVSELVTNAIVHGQGVIDVTVSVLGDRLRLEVTDEGQAVPRAGGGTLETESIGGWGLRLVDSLSDDWGSADGGEGTRVWMERSARRPASGGSGPDHA